MIITTFVSCSKCYQDQMQMSSKGFVQSKIQPLLTMLTLHTFSNSTFTIIPQHRYYYSMLQMQMLGSREVTVSHSYQEMKEELTPNSVLLQDLRKLYGMLPPTDYNETLLPYRHCITSRCRYIYNFLACHTGLIRENRT